MEEVLECSMHKVRSPGFTPEAASNLSSLRPMEHPAIQRRVRGRVKRPMQGRLVVAKVMRVYPTSDVKETKRVSRLDNLQTFH